jgi:hypothetical protein
MIQITKFKTGNGYKKFRLLEIVIWKLFDIRQKPDKFWDLNFGALNI